MADSKPIPKTEFSNADVEILERETLYRGFFTMELYRLRHRLFAGGWSGEISRELFVCGDAVGVVLYDPRHDLIGLVEQFRIGALNEPLGPWCLEVVAGMIEAGESPAAVVERELLEEANLRAERLEFICRYLSTPGGSDERLHLYCGLCDLTGAGGIHGLDEEQEDIRVHALPADAVFANLYADRFNNAPALICLQWLQLNRARLQNSS